MSERAEPQIAALRTLGDEFRRIAADPVSEPAPRRPNGRVALALGLGLLLALTLFSFTPPGRAIAERIGDLVGIGGPATLPPQKLGYLPKREPAIVIASGRAPDGTPYEVVADRSYTKRSNTPVTCLTLDLPHTPQVSASEFCFASKGPGLDRGDAIEAVDFIDRAAPDLAPARFGPKARYVITGSVKPEVAAVRVTFTGQDGRRHRALSDVGQLDGEIREKLGSDSRSGLMVAFLPDDRLAPAASGRGPGHRRYAGVLGTVTIVGLNSSGDAIARDEFGRRMTEIYANERRRRAKERLIRRRVQAAIGEGRLGVRLCLEALRTNVARQRCIRVITKNSHENVGASAVIGTGRTPSGKRYVISAAKGLPGQIAPEGHPPTCFGLAIPELGQEGRLGSLCPGRGLRDSIKRHDVFPYLSLGPLSLGSKRLIASGLVAPAVTRVEVRFGGTSVRRALRANLVHLGPKGERRIGGDDHLGYFLAFLSERLMPHPRAVIDPEKPPHWVSDPKSQAKFKAALSRIEIRAYSKDGDVVARSRLDGTTTPTRLYPLARH